MCVYLKYFEYVILNVWEINQIRSLVVASLMNTWFVHECCLSIKYSLSGQLFLFFLKEDWWFRLLSLWRVETYLDWSIHGDYSVLNDCLYVQRVLLKFFGWFRWVAVFFIKAWFYSDNAFISASKPLIDVFFVMFSRATCGAVNIMSLISDCLEREETARI